MVRMDSFSSLPPHIQPPMAQVPSAIRELTRFVPSMLMYSSMLPYLLIHFEIVVLLAERLRVSVGAIEVMSRFILFELTGFGGLYRLCEKRSNLRRIHRLKTAS